MARVRRVQLITLEISYEIDTDSDLDDTASSSIEKWRWQRILSRTDWNKKILHTNGQQVHVKVEHAGPQIEREVEDNT